jgi:hypothetical protein
MDVLCVSLCNGHGISNCTTTVARQRLSGHHVCKLTQQLHCNRETPFSGRSVQRCCKEVGQWASRGLEPEPVVAECRRNINVSEEPVASIVNEKLSWNFVGTYCRHSQRVKSHAVSEWFAASIFSVEGISAFRRSLLPPLSMKNCHEIL